jgi:hypothetical protein
MAKIRRPIGAVLVVVKVCPEVLGIYTEQNVFFVARKIESSVVSHSSKS